jgi:sporulation protein YlmC with PRC-barrel domain
MFANTNKILSIATLVLAGSVSAVGAARAQVAGSSTTLGVTVTEATQVAQGFSAKKNMLGKPVYNDAGERIGDVDDLIIAPDKKLSYLIVGAGGFVGIGRHDVAIPISQITRQDGRLVIPGATRDLVKSMPEFVYADDTMTRDQFVADAEKDIQRAREKANELEQQAARATGDAKVNLDRDAAALRADARTADKKLAEMKRAGARRWRELEGDVRAATARLRKSLASRPATAS